MINLKLIVIFVFLLSIAPVQSQVPRLVPEAYWGTAFVDGNPAKEGSWITVEVQNTGEVVGTGQVMANGLYSVDVIFDNELTPEDEGANEGDKLIWKIDGIPIDVPAPGEDTANSGGVNSNFNIFLNNADRDNIPLEFATLIIIIILLLITILIILLKVKWKF